MNTVNRFIVPALLYASVLAACGSEAPPPAGAPPPQVTVAEPLARPIVDWDNYVGQFEAVQTVQVRPRVSGYLVAVHFEDGQVVPEGAPLFTIDARPFQAALDEAQGRVTRAEAVLDNARIELERARSLVDIQAVSQEELEAQEAAVRTAEAELRAARAVVRGHELNLEFTQVTAPVTGRASYRRVDVGNAVRADETVLTTVVSTDPIHFVFEGSESLYLKYKRQQLNGGGVQNAQVRIRLQDESEYAWTGRLNFMDNVIDGGSGTIRGRAVVENPDGFLTPGMFGHMQLEASREYTGLLLPDSAIATQGAQRVVFVADEGAVRVQPVELGPLNGGLRVIRSGLTARDRVIIDGQQRARAGQPVDAELAQIRLPGGGDGAARDATAAAGSARR